MADKVQVAGGANTDTPGMPYYEKSRQHLKELLQKRKVLERQLHTREEAISQKESEYLENTISGNIITGFDNYVKGITGAAAQRRKTGLTEANRVFSRSSISYNTSFKDGSNAGSGPGSGQATPTSTTASKAAHSKKKKTAASAAAAASGVDDSETDSTRETKKVRTSFGTVRK
ncbi:hypothetical protein SPBR_08676 [Sporothrix brasiliensis 5110]|uniref:Chromatin modification-related protein EAF6 n=1 Tax=Sporothrix brasiliensis 5110 TaxID=1398154 RepID=A0A0C2ELK3_9PEZI|nr:uncharacterized protein SPBR_08676 [Sporothrix brasiliensis 5110]KIH86994.1 hypothetical protein SPBR_08676 [Sporothrix brasiliensis 5110]